MWPPRRPRLQDLVYILPTYLYSARTSFGGAKLPTYPHPSTGLPSKKATYLPPQPPRNRQTTSKPPRHGVRTQPWTRCSWTAPAISGCAVGWSRAPARSSPGSETARRSGRATERSARGPHGRHEPPHPLGQEAKPLETSPPGLRPPYLPTVVPGPASSKATYLPQEVHTE